MSKVMVVDSGVGGLSIAQHVAGLAPSSLLCLSDKAFFPYGQRETHELENILISLVAQGIDHWGLPDAIVIACNTASTRILDALRARFQLPFVGVVPAVKPAAQLTTTGVFGVLATASTVNSHYLKWLIESFAAGRRVITLACNELVEAIEREISDQYVLEDDDLVSLLAPLFEGQGKHIDVLVLACTHFPLLRSRIEGVLPQLSQQKCQVIDSGAAVARQVSRFLPQSGAPTQVSFLTRVSKDGLLTPPVHAPSMLRLVIGQSKTEHRSL